MARDHRFRTAVRIGCDVSKVRSVVTPVHHRHIDGSIGRDLRRSEHALTQRRRDDGHIRSQRIKEHRHRTERRHHVTNPHYRALPNGSSNRYGTRIHVDIDA